MIKTIGILGGMGPEATAYFYQKIIKFTNASEDQNHIPTLIYSNPCIPDRTKAILKNKHGKIVKQLQCSAKILENAGADFIVIPCDTAHFYIKEIQKTVTIPIVDMIQETAYHIHNNFNARKVGLLATTGTVKTKIYENKFNRLNIEVIIPDERQQQNIMKATKEIKSGMITKQSYDAISSIINDFNTKGIKITILGCTELPLLFKNKNIKNIIDPMDILAISAIEKAGKHPKLLL